MATQQQKNTPSSGGSAAGLILFLVVVLCLGMMAAAGYCEFHLGMSESAMMAAVAGSSDAAAAKTEAQFWSLLLTFISWGSLIVACACAVGIYLSMQGRQSAPLRALAQSVKNMAHGDLKTSVWGMERRDAIGELARAIDMARYQFNQLPDMSLMSDKGPVRLRFEGNSKSLFDAMMAAMNRDSELVRAQATTLADTINKQQEVVGLLSSRVEAVLHNVERRGLDGDKQVQEILHNMLSSAEGLKHAQEHAADQLNRILPFLQERAQGMSEITQIAGKQIAQSLQSLTLSERGLKSSADQSTEAIQKLAATANELGDRMFGAVNLLQASGKILSETTESTQAQLQGVISRLDKDISNVVGDEPVATTGNVDMTAVNDTLAAKFSDVVAAFETAQQRLQDKITQYAEDTKDSIAHVADRVGDVGASLEQKISSQADGIAERVGVVVGEQLSAMPQPVMPIIDLSKLDAINEKLDLVSQKQDVLDTVMGLMQAFEGVESKIDALAQVPAPVFDTSFVDVLQSDMRSGAASTTQSIGELRKQLGDMATKFADLSKSSTVPDELKDQMRDHWYQMAGQIEATRNSISDVIARHITRLEAKIQDTGKAQASSAQTDDVSRIIEQQTGILSELVGTMGVLDAHMQDIRSQVAGLTRRAS